MTPRYVIGAVVSDHDSSVCLLRDGALVACVNEERLCRVRKGDRRNSIRRALTAVLAEAGIRLADVAAIFCDTDHYFAPDHAPVPVFPDFPDPSRIYQITHHVGHTASAFLPSPFDEAAFLTIDASGGIAPIADSETGKAYWSMTARETDFMARGFRAAHAHPYLADLLAALPGGEARNYPAESLTAGTARRGEPMMELWDDFAQSSLGYFYALCSHFLDMEEGHFMGLASYGKPGPMLDAMREVIRLEDEGHIRIDSEMMHFWQDRYVLDDPVSMRRLSTRFLKTFGPGRKFFDPITQRHMDFAHAAQARLEEAMVHVAKHLRAVSGMKNLVLAGGVALNSVGNGVVLREAGFERIFIQPAASDDGLALGFALFGDHVLGDCRDGAVFRMGSAFLGPDRDAECAAFVEQLEQGLVEIEYLDPLPFTRFVDILWKGPGDRDFERTRMRHVGGGRHVAHLPIAARGGLEYHFDVHAASPDDYERAAAESSSRPDELPGAYAGNGNGRAHDPRRPTDPFEMFLYDHRDIAGILDGERAFVGPEQVVIDPTNRCDNNCLACWTYSPLLGDAAPPEDWFRQQMPPELMHRTIDELADLGTRRVRFTGGGEPFVHPQMIEFLEHVKSRGMIACVTTNFTALTSEKVRRMSEIGVDEVTASIWAGTPDMYARSHPKKTARTFEKIEALLKEFTASKPAHARLYIANVLFSMNYVETREMYHFAVRCGADGIYFALVDSVAPRTDGLLLTPPHIRVLREHLAEVKTRVDELNRTRAVPFVLDNYHGLMRRLESIGATRGDYDAHAVDAIPCYVGWTFCRITPDGQVVPCCRGVDKPMGNLHKQTFTEIWADHRYREFRRMALREKKSHPYFAEIGCHRTCDNLMHNENEHARFTALGAEEREHLVRFVVRGEAR